MLKLRGYIFCLCTLSTLPFTGFSQVRVGVRGGGAISSVLFSSSLYTDAAQTSHAEIQKSVNTYYGGGILAFKIGKTFIIRPGIEYFRKSWKVEANDRGRISTFRLLRNYNINYIEIPVNLLLTTPVGNGKVYLGVGPYGGFALSGTVKVPEQLFNLEFTKFNEPVVTYQPDNSYQSVQYVSHFTINRIDYGVNAIIGYEFLMGLIIEAGVDIGVRQISTSFERYDLQRNKTLRDPESSSKYSIFRVGAGWLFSVKNHRSR